jgi:sigma-54-interacting transcriptional regulator
VFVRRTVAPSTVASGPSPEWAILRTRRPNVLFTEWHAATDVIMATLRPYLRPPVYCWVPDSALPEPREVMTLLICDVATLSLDHQRALLSWLDHAALGQTQVVSTTALELFSLVEHGMFLEALYYRLNTVRLDAPVHRAVIIGH